MAFVQMMTIKTDNIAPIEELMEQWHSEQSGVAPGYVSNRLLKDRETGTYSIEVEFSSFEEAQKNNERSVTAEWAGKLNELISGEAIFTNYDVL